MKSGTITRRNLFAVAVAAAIGCVLALAGCSAPANDQASSNASNEASSPSSAVSSTTDKTTSGDLGRVLVAYYSGSGNTAAVAEGIATDLGADIFEITPVEPYTEEDLNWRDESSRVNAEHEDEALRNIPLVQVTPDDFAQYDTVILGYPIWWAIAAWPVDNFVAGNDFTGKTVIPFCTSTSSGIGDSAKLLEELAGTGTWLEGHRFPSNPTREEVASWVEEL